MIRAARRIVATLFALAVVWGLWLLADGTRPYLRAPETPIFVDILRGTRTQEIAHILEERGVIRSRWTFLALHALQPGRSLKAGEYEFEQPASPFEILGKLVRGEVSFQVLIIPEGFNRFEIAGAVAVLEFSTREQFLRATEDPSLVADLAPQARDLEGYLYPDTYQFPRHARPAQIVKAMVERFRQVYSTLPRARASRPIHEVVTVASLVEKETGVAEERTVVAGVFYNRLRRGMALQADPTVIYAAMLEDRYDGKIRQSDLGFQSPYNTYLHSGLPPGPIANPGKDSLLAALQPAETEYLYFVAHPERGHTFSKTLAEHNLAVGLYRKDSNP